MKAQKYKVILASASPRRKEILAKTGIEFEVHVSDCDENIDEKQPDKLVMKLSELKARDVASKNPDAIIIGSDTVVAHKRHIMGKPADRAEAISMIKSFAGDIHQVYTGVTIIIPNEKTYTYNVCTDVHVLPMTDEEIERIKNLPDDATTLKNEAKEIAGHLKDLTDDPKRLFSGVFQVFGKAMINTALSKYVTPFVCEALMPKYLRLPQAERELHRAVIPDGIRQNDLAGGDL